MTWVLGAAGVLLLLATLMRVAARAEPFNVFD